LPAASDIAAQANVGFRGNCGSGRRTLETSRMTDAVEKGLVIFGEQ
jgi:hypothetical protein